MTAEVIQQLNDALRTTFQGGRVMLTATVNGLQDSDKIMLFDRVRSFSEFTEANDPHGEHDCAGFTFKGERYMFKIDYYDPTMSYVLISTQN